MFPAGAVFRSGIAFGRLQTPTQVDVEQRNE